MAFFFHSDLNPAELLSDTISHHAGACKADDWAESTFQRMITVIGDLARRPLHFFLGVDIATIRRTENKGYDVFRICP